MISAIFRRGGDVSFVVEELKAVFDPQGGQWMGGRYVPSLLAAIGQVIETHMLRTGFLAPPRLPGEGEAGAQAQGIGRRRAPSGRASRGAAARPARAAAPARCAARRGAWCAAPADTPSAIDSAPGRCDCAQHAGPATVTCSQNALKSHTCSHISAGNRTYTTLDVIVA